jgi:hypothetical protein
MQSHPPKRKCNSKYGGMFKQAICIKTLPHHPPLKEVSFGLTHLKRRLVSCPSRRQLLLRAFRFMLRQLIKRGYNSFLPNQIDYLDMIYDMFNSNWVDTRWQ